MNNPKPDDIRRGQPITAQFLNDSKNTGIHDVRFGAGLVGQRIGDKLVIARGVEPRTRPGLGYRFSFLAEITASSSSSEDHSFVEVDENLDKITDGKGRESSTAKAFNGRKGVPVTTIVAVWQYAGATDSDQANPQYYFQIPDGLTTTPKDLILDGLTADTTTYDIEADSEPVQVNNGRVWFGTPIAAFFWRDTTYDASGMQTLISDESRFRLIADLDDASYEGAIAFVADGLDGGYLKHNQPQATTYTLTLESDDASVTFNGGASSATVTFDEGGHYNLGNTAISIEATGGGGSADGQGFEVVTDGTTTVSETDGGTVLFSDTANSSTTLGVNFAVASNTPADPLTATVTATVDASGLTAGDVGASEVYDEEIRVASTAAAGTYTLDSRNFAGRVLHYHSRVLADSSVATWDDASQVATNTQAIYVPSSETSDTTLTSASGGSSIVFIDASDGNQLKILIVGGLLPSSGNFDFIRLHIVMGERKTAADQTFS